MPNKPYDPIAASQITPEAVYKDRRRLMQGMATAAAVALVGCDTSDYARMTADPALAKAPGMRSRRG